MALVAGLLSATAGPAQEFEPRTYAVAPVGLNFLAIGYGYSSGAVFMDPALPVEDVDAEIHVAVARYIRTLSIFNLPAKLKLMVPWTDGHWDGFLEGEFRTRDATGFGDARIVLETLFAGAEAMTHSEMAEYEPGTVWGAKLQFVLPTGDYDNTKVINLGSNRWGLIPEFGFSHPVGKWSLEASFGAWIFGDNDDFVEGLLLEQDPLLVTKFHAIRSIRPGFWWAIAAGFGYGGRTTVEGVKRDTIQRNWRVSAMLVYPISRSQGLSITIGSGGNAGAGTDFDAIAVGYQYSWGAG
jgi:hypothetical protein